MRSSRVTISDKWVRASIIGTIWAAAEIVLGSFLHNLRVPFSGNVLTAIALVILIAVSYRWREHGLYWRAGLICAVMKTMSPSAVIFGPMIAIIAESLLLELMVRLLGHTIAGYITGAMLAMSWNLFHKIINMIIFYGGNLVEIYASFTDYASRQLSLQFNAFWAPLLLMLTLYALFGVAAGVAGIVTGRRLAALPPDDRQPSPVAAPSSARGGTSDFRYSPLWLAADLMLVAGMLVVISLLSWIWWIIIVVPVIAILALRYKRAMRQLSKPRFWITFVIITMLSAIAFSSLGGRYSMSEAVLIGIQMNFRAVIIIVGFSALGTELYNPDIRNLFSRTRLRQLPLALELSTAALPAMIADMPDLRTAVRNPVMILNRMITRVERRLQEVREEQRSQRRHFITTGNMGEGKTAWLVRLSSLLKEKGVRRGGILALRVMEGGETTGYDIADIRNGTRTPFLVHTGQPVKGVERFRLIEEGQQAGERALDPAQATAGEVLFVDEVGVLELRGEGWSRRVRELLDQPRLTLVIAVRRSLVEEVRKSFGLEQAELIDVATADAVSYAELIAETANKKSIQ